MSTSEWPKPKPGETAEQYHARAKTWQEAYLAQRRLDPPDDHLSPFIFAALATLCFATALIAYVTG